MIGGCFVAVASCVGDSSIDSDGGPDVTTVDAPADVVSDASIQDVVVDGGGDAAACDLTKPFATPVPLSGAVNSTGNTGGICVSSQHADGVHFRPIAATMQARARSTQAPATISIPRSRK